MTKTCWAPGCIPDIGLMLTIIDIFCHASRQVCRIEAKNTKRRSVNHETLLCDLHFEEHFVVKADNFSIRRDCLPSTVTLDFDWGLNTDLFSNLPKYLSTRQSMTGRQLFIDDDHKAAKVQTVEQHSDSVQNSANSEHCYSTRHEGAAHIMAKGAFSLEKENDDRPYEFLCCITLFKSYAERMLNWKRNWTATTNFLKRLRHTYHSMGRIQTQSQRKATDIQMSGFFWFFAYLLQVISNISNAKRWKLSSVAQLTYIQSMHLQSETWIWIWSHCFWKSVKDTRHWT